MHYEAYRARETAILSIRCKDFVVLGWSVSARGRGRRHAVGISEHTYWESRPPGYGRRILRYKFRLEADVES